jgi:hypothetical protein
VYSEFGEGDSISDARDLFWLRAALQYCAQVVEKTGKERLGGSDDSSDATGLEKLLGLRQ